MIFHRDIGFPSIFRRPVGRYRIVLSLHARARAREKNIVVPSTINLNDFDIIEIEIVKSRLVKMVIRGEYDDYDDICMAVSPENGRLFVRTVWLNHWNDTHRTLDRSKYGRP